MSDEKRRSKRQSAGDEGLWECSMCTYRNPPEFFKCEICECRKGTSTRRPRVTSQLAAQQVAQTFLPPPPKKERREKKERRDRPDPIETNQSVSSIEGSADGELEVADIPETKPAIEAPPQEDSLEGEREEPDIPESQPCEYVPPPAPPKLKKEPSTSKPEPPTHSTKCNITKKSKSSRLKNIDRSSGQSMEVTVNNITVIITDYQLKKDKVTTTNSSATATTTTNHIDGNNKINTSSLQALHERDGESKDSFSSSITDTVQSSGEGDLTINNNAVSPSTVMES